MKYCRFLLALTSIVPMVWGEAVAVTGNASNNDAPAPALQSSAPGTSVFALPGARPLVRKQVAPDPKPDVATGPKVPAAKAFEGDSAVYFPSVIGKWKLADAHRLLGEPMGHRPSFDEDKAVTGQIYAYPDPSNHYRQVELDFDHDSGLLRAVFIYPTQMSWQECRRLWGGNVETAQAGKGRTFYSYQNRHLDVLVDEGGKVISLGLY